MALTIEATYENGVLKPVQPLSVIQEGARLWLTLHIAAESERVRKAYGLLAGRAMPRACGAWRSTPNSTFWRAHDVPAYPGERVRIHRCQHLRLLLHTGPAPRAGVPDP